MDQARFHRHQPRILEDKVGEGRILKRGDRLLDGYALHSRDAGLALI